MLRTFFYTLYAGHRSNSFAVILTEQMNPTLDTTSLNNRTSLKTWFQSTARPFVARWWLWFALIVCPAYLTYYFSESSLENRISETLKNSENLQEEYSAETRASLAARSGFFVGTVIGTVFKGWRPFLMLLLLLIALIHLQYRYIFQPLFEQDAIGRRAYISLVFLDG